MPHRKISRCPVEFIDIIYQVANTVKITDIEYVIESGSDDDINSVLSDTYKVIINGYRQGQKIQLDFLVKWVSDPKKRQSFRHLYHREYSFQCYVVPKLLQIQNSFNVIEGLKMTFENCTYANIEESKETLVYTSLIKQGYMLHDRFHKMDLDHCSLVIKSLAKQHALFFVLQYVSPNECEIIKLLYQKDVQYSDPSAAPKSMLDFYMDSVDVVTDPVAKRRLKELGENIFLILYKCANPDTKFGTICHADCWNNNIVFKYQGKRPVDVVLIDYQTSRYASPVTDISYFLYMTAEQAFLENHYDRLTDLYFKTLAAVLRQCNLNVEEIYPKRIFEQDLKEYSVLGLIESLISMKIITAESEEAFEMAEMRYEITEKVLRDRESQNQSLFVERVNGVVNDFFKREYFLDKVLNK